MSANHWPQFGVRWLFVVTAAVAFAILIVRTDGGWTLTLWALVCLVLIRRIPWGQPGP